MISPLKPARILLVEDNAADVRLTREGLQQLKISNELSHVEDGEQALDFLYQRGNYVTAERPDLILLDLNLPRLGGREVLKTIKSDAHLASIPVVVLTTLTDDEAREAVYEMKANCFISKPLEQKEFMQVILSIGNFWFSVARLPD